MQRLHLFELEDFDWFPAVIRDGGTDFLDTAFDRVGFYSGVAGTLIALLHRTNATQILDLASGGGGGTLQLRRYVRAAGLPTAFQFSDRFPSEAGGVRVGLLGDPQTRYLAEPVDAMDGGGDGPGLRTMAGALHHFTPEAVREIFAGIVRRRAPLAFFDIAPSPALRRMPSVFLPLAMAANMLLLFVAALLVVPFLRPLRLSRLFLTYVVPAIPLLIAWDGTVSALRAYTVEELLTLARSVPGAERYDWQAGTVGRALYITGEPR
jgi:hypothetical protein